MAKKISGIKSVDFKIVAKGEGVVNWNGSFSLYNPQAEKSVKNHALPKMRGLDPMRLKSLNSELLESAKLFVSQNCVRKALFKNESYGLKSVDCNNVDRVLCSILGLVRGFVIADQITKLSLKRKSALLLEDLVDHSTKLRYEQFSNSGERNETSIFSKTSADETTYEAYGSISIEDLQFIVLEDSFNRSSYSDIITVEQGHKIESQMNEFLEDLATGTDKKPKATFHTNYVRIAGITQDGEAGLLLNEDAIELIVKEMLYRLENLVIQQSKGYLRVVSIVVDYNSGRAMRIKDDEMSVSAQQEPFAIYFEAKEQTEKEFVEKMKKITEKRKLNQKKEKTQTEVNKD